MTPSSSRPPAAGAARWLPGVLGTLVSVAVILLLTLKPGGDRAPVEGIGLCLICGEFGTANLLRNVLLFFPLGAALALLVRRPLWAWLPTLALTLGIEGAQLVIPGRNTLVVDAAANAAGGALGVWFVFALGASLGRGKVLRGGSLKGLVEGWVDEVLGWQRAAREGLLADLLRLRHLWVGLPFGVLAATGVAFQLAPPEAPHHIQITPRLSHLAWYSGEVNAAVLAGRPLQIGRYPDPTRLEADLLGGRPLEVEFEVASRARSVAPLVSVYTAAQRELFLVGVAGDDVVVRLPYRAAPLRLDRPDLRLAGAMVRTEAGDRARLIYRAAPDGLARGGVCLHLDDRGACGLRPTVARGWGLLLYPAGLSRTVHRTVDVAWLLSLAALVGLFLRSTPAAALLGGALVGWAALVPRLLSSVAWAPPGELLLLLGGVAAGHAVRHLLRRPLLPWLPFLLPLDGSDEATPVATTPQPRRHPDSTSR